MTLTKGDHLVIKRNGKILEGEGEAYIEFEVLNYPASGPDGDGNIVYLISAKVVK